MLAIDLVNTPTPGPLWTISVPAGMARRIGDLRAMDAVWSPNGSEIAYVTGPDLFRANLIYAQLKRLRDSGRATNHLVTPGTLG